MATSLTAGATIVGALVVIGIIMYAGYQVQTRQATPTVTPTTSAEITTSPTPSTSPDSTTTTSPTISSSSRTTTNSSSTRISASHGTTKPTVTITPHPTNSSSSNNSERRIVFVDTPTSVRSGQSFTVTWRIEGPAGETGEQTTITTHYAVSKTSGGSSSSTNSNNTNSFGSFTIPATYSTNLSYGGDEGTIEITVTAEVNGQTLTAHRDISLTN